MYKAREEELNIGLREIDERLQEKQRGTKFLAETEHHIQFWTTIKAEVRPEHART